jgi:hypothetical protein
MSHLLKSKIIEQIEYLSDEQKKKTLDYMYSLKGTDKQGVSGKNLLRFAGAIPEEELRLMEEAIESGCERVEANE